jgi:protein-tyrosine-phosphatase
MAIGWLSVLQAVPWSDVIANAPKVAEGAKKLWSTVARKPVPSADDLTQPTEAEAMSPQAQALAVLDARVAAMEAAATQMHEQLLASSELIKALAEQNAQLVQRIEANRVRVTWLTWVAVIGAGAGLSGLALAWASRLA